MGTDRTTPSWRTRAAVIVAGATLGLIATMAPVSAQEEPTPQADDLTASPVEPSGEPITSPKASTSQIAESDPALLGRTDATPTPVMVKLDYDAIATYDGSLRGLPATSPSVTDDPLTNATVTRSAYARHIARTESEIVGAMQAEVPAIRVGTSFQVVYGGVSAVLPANQVDDLLTVPGVVAVQADELNQLLTDSSPAFIGAPPVWNGLGGQATAGNGVLFASLDSGVWPEHPSLADTGATPTKPLRPDNTPIECTFGDDPRTGGVVDFACNDKLVGGRPFLNTYNTLVGGELYPDSARDSNGHGTHTATTAAGNIVDAEVDGTDRGQVSGVAPGAWVVSYKVCGKSGCYGSDTAAAVQAAILDGVDVINFSISGGATPATDPTELAFLDAYAAGVFVAASAGNAGPGPDTIDHLGPWVTTVAASTPNRQFQAAVTYTANGVPGSVTGTSIDGQGTGATPRPVVLASAPPYSNATCSTPAPPALFQGKIVVCDNSSGRVTKSFNVMQGDAVGMILASVAPSTLSTDSYWLPTVHIDQVAATTLKTAIGTGATTATLAPGTATAAPGDQIAVFSSRGPRGEVIKPDLAAPGVQVLAGATPQVDTISAGGGGEFFQAINGTSMAAPHVAGAGLLLRDQHPDWTPGQIRSALMTSAKSGLTTEEDGQAATPFDEGSGRIRIDAAADPGLVLDETAANYASLGLDPLTTVHLNIPSIDAPKMPGKVVTTRTFTNTGGAATYTASTQVGGGSTIEVEPSTFTIPAGGSQTVTITITSANDGGGTELGSISLASDGRPNVRIPVAFDPEPGDVTITPTGCTPSTVDALESSTCGYTVDNLSYTDSTVDLRAEGDAVAKVTGADQGATTAAGVATADDVPIEGRNIGVPTTASGAAFGYIPLDTFGTTPTAVGDEQFVSYNVPSFVFNGVSYSAVSVSSNGYVVAGGGATASDQNCCNLTTIGDPARPNNVIAPFWTDLDGTGTPGIYVTTLTDGVGDWLVVEWRVNAFGTSSQRKFQTWIGLNDVQDITFSYDPAALPAPPAGQNTLIGAENSAGDGIGLPVNTAPTGDLRVTSTDPSPGASVTWNVTAEGIDAGTAVISAEASSPLLPGSDLTSNQLVVEALPLPVATEPADQSVTALETASFSSTATGGTFARWEVSTNDGGAWTTVPGATSSPLSFTAHGDQDGNWYRAVFANATGHEQESEHATLAVAKIATDTEVTVAPASPVRNQAVTFTADTGVTTATGTVQFALDGAPYGAPVALAAGKATSPSISTLAAGNHTVTATYAGDTDHAASDDDAAFEVLKIGSDTSVVTILPSPIVTGDDALITVKVLPVPTGGNVQLKLNGANVGGPVTLDATTGAATITVPGLDPGDYTATAVFSGDADLLGSTSAGVTFTVDKIATDTEITGVSPTAIVVGDDIVVDVDVAPDPDAGSIQLKLDGTDAGPATGVSATGGATITLSDVPVGDHEITATYSGDADHLASTSDVEDITVIGGDEAFVRRGYQIVLGRNADPSGAAFWTDRLGRGFDRASFIKELAEGPEGRRHSVRTAFVQVLGRGVDPSGLAFWSNRLANGTTVEQLVAELLASSESYAKGGSTPTGYAQRLYTVLLGRAGNASGTAFWANRVANANSVGGRKAIAISFGRSNEATNVAVTRAGVLACGADHVITPGDRTTMAELWAIRGHHAQKLAGTALRISCPPDEG